MEFQIELMRLEVIIRGAETADHQDRSSWDEDPHDNGTQILRHGKGTAKSYRSIGKSL